MSNSRRLARPSGWSRTTVAAWTLWAVSLVCVALSLVTARWSGAEDPGGAVVGGLAVVSLVTTGAFLTSRLPRHRIGWLLVLGGLVLGASGATSGLADYGLTVHPGAVPGVIWLAWVSEWTWAPEIACLFILLPLFYPTGRLPSPRWRAVVSVGAALVLVGGVASALSPWAPDPFPVDNPLALGGAAGGVLSFLNNVVGTVLVVSGGVLAVASLVVRYRRGSSIERAQLKWFAAVAMITGAGRACHYRRRLGEWRCRSDGHPGHSRRCLQRPHLPRSCPVADRHRHRRTALPPLRDRPAHQPHPRLRPRDRRPGWRCSAGLVLGLQATARSTHGRQQLAVAGSTCSWWRPSSSPSGDGCRGSWTGASTAPATTPSGPRRLLRTTARGGRSRTLQGACSRSWRPPWSRRRCRCGCAHRGRPAMSLRRAGGAHPTAFRTITGRLSARGAARPRAAARGGGRRPRLPPVLRGVRRLGAVFVVRRPHNVIGWLLLLIAALELASGVTFPGPAGPLVSGTAPLAERLLALLSDVSTVPIFACGALLAVIFPSGRLPTGRWGIAVRVLIALNVLLLLPAPSDPPCRSTLTDGSTINAANPVALFPASWEFLSGPAFLCTLASAVLAVGSMAVRLRRARGVERLQLRWVVAALALSCGGLVVAVVSGAWPLAGLCFATIPVAIGIAILRYRLYEIDRLISRTIGWGVLTVLLGGVFVGIVLGLQALLVPLTRSNEPAVAGSTLLVAALFQPLRRRVQGLVDRRFNRSRYDAQVALDAFSARLRDEVDLDTLQGSLLTLVEATLEPTTVSLWLRTPEAER